ncbi:MAG: hypothetical protein KatS3mg108_3551 [Isosphaeraceae bacterium]|jgi:putative membrane protein|nr:MAG: hypothetical protein KatS3mg108_3551 [Isosphaeraceae bacterium]
MNPEFPQRSPIEAGTPPVASERVRDHLANERTFLAWIRTALATLGFGFVLARVGLFLRELPSLVQSPATPAPSRLEPAGEFVLAGVVFLGVGTIVAGWAAWHYERNRRLLLRDVFMPARISPRMVASLVFISGLILIGMVIGHGLVINPWARPVAPRP